MVVLGGGFVAVFFDLMRSFEHEGQGRQSGNLVPEPTGEGSERCSSSTQRATPGMRLYP